jgi:hypothetical protein
LTFQDFAAKKIRYTPLTYLSSFSLYPDKRLSTFVKCFQLLPECCFKIFLTGLLAQTQRTKYRAAVIG